MGSRSIGRIQTRQEEQVLIPHLIIDLLQLGTTKIDLLESKMIFEDGRTNELTARETELIKYLLEAGGEPVSGTVT